MNKKKILIVDDEEILTRSFSKLLEKSGYETYTAKNGQDAEAMVEEEDFDLVICDIRMPGVNGIETIKKIKQISAANGRVGIPVVFITGFANEENERQARTLKPIAYLNKPFDIGNLLNVIRKAID